MKEMKDRLKVLNKWYKSLMKNETMTQKDFDFHYNICINEIIHLEWKIEVANV